MMEMFHVSYKEQIAELEMVKEQLLQNNQRLKTQLKRNRIDPTQETDDIRKELKMVLSDLTGMSNQNKIDFQDSSVPWMNMSDGLKELVKRLKEEIEKIKLERVEMQNTIGKFVRIFRKMNKDQLDMVF